MSGQRSKGLAITPAEQQTRLLHIQTLHARYADGSTSPADTVREVYRRIRERGDDNVWISLVPEAQSLAEAEALGTWKQDGTASGSAPSPLWGIPFAVKDNIDVAGMPTTAGCPSYAYTATDHAPVVQHLLDAGAILIGKTNLDQFATGLVGTRSPHGACASVFNDEYISGGSSSGSAVAVAAGLVSFSLGTDTAGSGRVPAAFNGILGLKPTRGVVSTRGVVPACRSLDCVSVFATDTAGARQVLSVVDRFDARDPFARPQRATRCVPPAATALHGALARTRDNQPASLAPLRVGILDAASQQNLLGESERSLYQQSVDACRAAGAAIHETPYQPFAETAALLYSGPWVAERYAAVGEFLEANPPDADPTVRKIILGGKNHSAVDAFLAHYRLAELVRAISSTWDCIDVLLLPTAPRIFRHDEIAADPIGCNTQLGTFTNFVNLADMSALALPAGFDARGLPFGVTLLGPAHFDEVLLDIASLVTASAAHTETAPTVDVAVVGAHLSGQPLNYQLTDRGAVLLRQTATAAHYRLYALAGTQPAKPGLLRQPGFTGPGIEVEIWRMPMAEFGSFVAAIPSPLGIGTLELADGSTVKGFLCEPAALESAEEITSLAGWRAYRASLSTA
jgi:allophanate hydrolase